MQLPAWPEAAEVPSAPSQDLRPPPQTKMLLPPGAGTGMRVTAEHGRRQNLPDELQSRQ